MSTPTQAPTGLLTVLRDEWNTTLGATTHDFPDLGTHTCNEILEQISRTRTGTGRNHAAADRILHALITAAHAGDTIAERVVLQSMLPKAVSLARRSRGLIEAGGYELSSDSVTTAISAVWEAIVTYKLHNTRSVAANLGLNALHMLMDDFGTGRKETLETEQTDLDDMLWSQGVHATLEPDWGDSAFHDMVTVLTWALDTEALTRDDVRLIAKYYLGDNPGVDERKALADELEVTPGALQRQVSRLRVKLMTAVQDHIREHGSW